MSRIIHHAVRVLEVLRSSFRVAQAVESRLAPSQADLDVLGIDAAAFANVTRTPDAGRTRLAEARVPARHVAGFVPA